MESINNFWFASLVAVIFVAICYISLPAKHAEASYSQSAFSVLDKASAKGKGMTESQRQKIMDVWNISEEDLNRPVNIFGE